MAPKDRVYTSGAYPTYDGKCYNDETSRLSFEMGKDLDKDDTPYASCVRISSGPWCTGETIGLDVSANGMMSVLVPGVKLTLQINATTSLKSWAIRTLRLYRSD